MMLPIAPLRKLQSRIAELTERVLLGNGPTYVRAALVNEWAIELAALLTDLEAAPPPCPRCANTPLCEQHQRENADNKCMWCGLNHDSRDCTSGPAHKETPTPHYLARVVAPTASIDLRDPVAFASKALKNYGADVECGACMEIAFTGATTNEHSCSPEREICICAAVQMGGLVIRGHRHDDCLRNIRSRKLDAEPITQGFITSRNRFVDREEAMRLQKASGAKSCYSSDGELHGNILFSEDLY